MGWYPATSPFIAHILWYIVQVAPLNNDGTLGFSTRHDTFDDISPNRKLSVKGTVSVVTYATKRYISLG